MGELISQATFSASYEPLLRDGPEATGVFSRDEAGDRRWADLKARVVEHNIRWPSITQRSGSAEWRPCWRSQRRRPRIVSRTWLWREQFLRRLTGLRGLSTSQSSRTPWKTS